MKRIVTIQDISCLGKCSLTVALPIISAMGVETVVVPTAVLSNHTAFKEYTFCDLTDEIPKISDVWQKEGFQFDAVCSGYLGSIRQIELVKNMYQNFCSKDAIRFVDPAMADGGSLYKGFTPAFASAMAQLCAQADVIVPNLTEACIMTGTEYNENGGEEYYKDLVKRLADKGSANVVMTGFSLGEGEIGALSYARDTDAFDVYVNEKLPVRYHGTGDIFASVMVGAMMNGFTLQDAAALAVDFTLESVRYTMEDPDRRSYGVNFESAIPYLTDRIRSRNRCQRKQK